MKRKPAVGLLFIILTAAVVAADTVKMHNGDCISGVIISISGGIARIDTTYAGEIAIQLEAVSAIETDEPRAVALPGNLVVEGCLTAAEDGAGIRVGEMLHPAAPAKITALAADMESLDRLLNPPPPSKWSGAVDAGLALRSGNTDTTDAKLSAEIKRAGNRNTLTLNFAAAYGSADDALNTRRFQGDFRWQYYLKERLYAYTLGLAERDDGRKLDYRLQ
ncbi:MAG TPA: DUF481 domain-containing protein, partial [Candidatus Hydrogenedentes bacterium]|nr:DUF481 domain-containing protein [Candidatus Hydrogenedentota bacterium]